MPRGSNRSRRNSSGDWGIMELARERPVAAAAVAAGAAAAGLFLWSKRSQISNQLSNLGEQIGEWTSTIGQAGHPRTEDIVGLSTGGRSS